MGKKTDAYSLAVTTYGTQAGTIKGNLTAAGLASAQFYKDFSVAEQAHNAGKEGPARMVRLFQDWKGKKDEVADLKKKLSALARALEKDTVKFEEYIKKKKTLVKINPLKGKASMGTADATIAYAKQLIAADKLLCT
jgi:hypothetical protein